MGRQARMSGLVGGFLLTTSTISAQRSSRSASVGPGRAWRAAGRATGPRSGSGEAVRWSGRGGRGSASRRRRRSCVSGAAGPDRASSGGACGTVIGRRAASGRPRAGRGRPRAAAGRAGGLPAGRRKTAASGRLGGASKASSSCRRSPPGPGCATSIGGEPASGVGQGYRPGGRESGWGPATHRRHQGRAQPLDRLVGEGPQVAAAVLELVE